MGLYDKAEICEVVELYQLNVLSEIIRNTEIDLYTDDGFAIIQNLFGLQMEQLMGKIIKVFKENDLNITAEADIIQTDFLDAIFDLNSESFWPYCKPNSNS